VPLHATIRERSDAGTPVVVSEAGGEHARIYRDIAARTWAQVLAERGKTSRQPPRITIDE
jgi:ATP-binding protein involved in chromosome partitioning